MYIIDKAWNPVVNSIIKDACRWAGHKDIILTLESGHEITLKEEDIIVLENFFKLDNKAIITYEQ